MQEFASGGELRNMGDTGFLMKVSADTVSLVFSDNGVACSSGEGLDSAADFDDGASWAGGGDSDEEGIEGGLYEPFCDVGDIADEEGFGLIAVPAVDDCGDVDVNDVPGFEGASIGDTVADDFVDAGADGAGVAFVVEAGGYMAVVSGEGVGEPVEFVGGDAFGDVLSEEVDEFRVELSGSAQAFSFLRGEIQRDLFLQH